MSNHLATKNSKSAKSNFVNLSAYKFVTLDRLTERRNELLEFCKSLNLKGTILISVEGINCFIAGERPSIDKIIQFFESRPEYQGLPIKESLSNEQPFSRMLVRIKKEIIAFGVDGIHPEKRTSPKLPPEQLKKWLDNGKPIRLLDVRNDYEVDLGTFSDAVPIGVDSFRDFPDAVYELPESMKDETVVMFCTGGIRCEKAGPFMEQQGFENVFQLDGGILKYFEECGGQHFEGECFVFDKRVAVDADLNETKTEQCYACQHPLTEGDQESEFYILGESCPHCYEANQEESCATLRAREEQIAKATSPLPGSFPYDNHRPLNVPLRFDGLEMGKFLCDYHPHVDADYWLQEIENGRILYKHEPVKLESKVWAGQRLVHLIKGTVEPDVSSEIGILYEDSELIAVNKPAPLPMHPCGRFNRNSLSYILNSVYTGEKVRMTHRLDANTTGVVVFARKRKIAQQIQSQFESGKVEKVYLARAIGIPNAHSFRSTVAIGDRPAEKGIRLPAADGSPSLTEFECLATYEDGTSLIQCCPKTGRTNQIRIHLWELGLPIMNDPSYLPDGKLGVNQTLPLNQTGMCLHARQLKMLHPVEKNFIEFVAADPDWART